MAGPAGPLGESRFGWQVAEPSLWAHPAITGNAIMVKDAGKVICYSF